MLRIGSSSLLHCPEMACCIGAMISLPDIATSSACGCKPCMRCMAFDQGIS